MTMHVDSIFGIGPIYSKKLESVGIRTVDDLIVRCGLPLNRREVAALTGIREKQLLKWVQTADLMRLRGVDKDFSQLLDAAGIRSVTALRFRDPMKLHTQMAELNDRKKVVAQAPAVGQVSSWIASAQATDQRVYF